MTTAALTMTTRPAVFFDRDGVLNEAVVREGRPYPPADAAALRVDPDAPAAIAALRARGFAIVVVTNQPDVARGKTTRASADAINDALRATLAPDALYACFHDNADGCDCRKPAPGMLVRAAHELGLDLARSYLVGDRWSDIEAGRRAGCRTVLIERGYVERAADDPTARVAALHSAAQWILDDSRP